MIQLTPQMRIVVAVEPADFRRGIDGLARLCQDALTRIIHQRSAHRRRMRRGGRDGQKKAFGGA